jgi:hypothetical protein
MADSVQRTHVLVDGESGRHVGLAHTRGRFTGGGLDGDAFAATRVSAGVRWHP